MTDKPRNTNKTTADDVVQITRNVGDHLYGQTFKRSDAEALGIEDKDLRPLVTDRAIKPGDIETR